MAKASFEVYKDKAGKFRFRLRAPNGEIIAVSEAYEQKAGWMNGINTVKKYSDALIEDQTSKTP